jgi:hypothetical protein
MGSEGGSGEGGVFTAAIQIPTQSIACMHTATTLKSILAECGPSNAQGNAQGNGTKRRGTGEKAHAGRVRG